MFNQIKLSPLILFIILLIVLVIATAVKNLGLVSEGFNSFLYSADSFTDKKVFAYNNIRNITKIYDDIFYDPKNGNIVAVYGTQYTSEDDNTGQSVTQIDIVPRVESNIVSYNKGTDNKTLSQITEESKKAINVPCRIFNIEKLLVSATFFRSSLVTFVKLFIAF